MGRSSIWHRIRKVWVTLGIAFTIVFTVWSLIAYRASPAAHEALVSDELVTVTRGNGSWSFTPAPGRVQPDARLLFFPGALVNPVAYAPLARAAANAGYVTTILEFPRRGAFGGADDPAVRERALTLLRQDSGSVRWVVAGHSRGAVVATKVAAASPAGLAGLVIIGSSHPRDVSLSGLTIPVTKIVGTRDGLASPDEVRDNRHLLPASTHWVWIEGGNHSQFGWYGFQPGDRFARITRGQQHTAMINAVLAALRQVKRNEAQ